MNGHLNVNDTNINIIVEIILSIFDDKLISKTNIIFLTKQNYKQYAADRTYYNVDKDILFYYNSPDLSEYENLFNLVHECYHIVQVYNGQRLSYSEDDKIKYGPNKNGVANKMFMFYKYDFECEASGFAQVFVLYYLKTLKYLIKINLDNEIQTFSCPINVTRDDFETDNDYKSISKKISEHYNKALNWFSNKLCNYEIDNILKELKDKNDKSELEKIKFDINALNKKNFSQKMISLYKIIK